MCIKVTISALNNLKKINTGQILTFEGKVKKHEKFLTKNGKPYTKTSVMDETGQHDIVLFSEQCIKYRNLLYAKCNNSENGLTVSQSSI